MRVGVLALAVVSAAAAAGCGPSSGEARTAFRAGEEVVDVARGTTYDVTELGRASESGRARLPSAVVAEEPDAADEYFDRLAKAGLAAECEGLQTMVDEQRYPTPEEWAEYLTAAIANEAIEVPRHLEPLTNALVGGLYDYLDSDGDGQITVGEAESAQSTFC